MKVTIITCYESNEERASFVYDACKIQKHRVNVITTDYSHIKKQNRSISKQNYTYLKTKQYSRNLSLERVISHIRFAKDAFKLVEKQKPDVIWLMVPANSLLKEAKKYKISHNNVKIIVDVIDMWPESLPTNINKKIIPFRMWKNIRNNNIDCADLLITECDLYRDILEKEYTGKIKTIRWSKDKTIYKNSNRLSNNKLSLAYIGSINNIISSKLIEQVIDSIDIPVELHIIGEGENRYSFINSLRKHCEVIYHGSTRDEKTISSIFSKCHAGINIYRENLYIGLTVKCLDYFANGLPIINNIKGDTWDMVEKNNLGINYSKGDKIVAKDIIKLRKSSKSIISFYQNNFSKKIFIDKCIETINEVMQ